MLHPLFSTIIHRPDLVADHLSAYVALIHHEASNAGADLLKRAMAWVMVGVSALLFFIFAGTALMLGVLHQFHWILLAVPGVMLTLTVMAFFRAKTPLPSERFPELKAQIQNDAHALRGVA